MGEENLVLNPPLPLPSFFFGTNEQMASKQYTDGAFHVAIDEPQFYVDLNNQRILLSGGVILDDEISSTSIHPVQNNVIKAALDTKAESDIIAIQSTEPTSDSCMIWIKS